MATKFILHRQMDFILCLLDQRFVTIIVGEDIILRIAYCNFADSYLIKIIIIEFLIFV